MERILQAVALGDRIEATNLYMSITECGLTEAQKTIGEFTAEHNATKREELVVKKKKRLWGIFKSSE